MRTADGRWLKNAATGTDFFIGLGRLQGAELPEGSHCMPLPLLSLSLMKYHRNAKTTPSRVTYA
jgi:hypothetical protein